MQSGACPEYPQRVYRDEFSAKPRAIPILVNSSGTTIRVGGISNTQHMASRLAGVSHHVLGLEDGVPKHP